MLKIVCWNINQKDDAWGELLDSDYDIALIQEVKEPPNDFAKRVFVNPGEWRTGGAVKRPWRTAVAKISDEIDVEWIAAIPIESAGRGDFAVSRAGSISAAKVSKAGIDPIYVMSCYATWENYHDTLGSKRIYSDASAHRLISDISCFVSNPKRNRVIAAGDFNMLYGYGEHGRKYWKDRYMSVFERFESLGFVMAGPQFPQGRRASPWPDELPSESHNVPTYHTRQQGPSNATRQLDFVFASSSLASSVSVIARNEVEDWGPSDHCRLDINVTQ